jgi:hypothetical protein
MSNAFFRVRQQLAKDNKFGKFVGVAVVEMSLIIVGILIALQIDNWNQNHISTKIETKLLQRLKQDLEADVVRFNELESYYRENKESHDKFEELLNKAELSDEDIVSLREFWGVDIKEINPRLNTYEEMLNLGKLYSISDELIVQKISEYYRSLDREIADIKEQKVEYRRYFTNDRSIDFWRLGETDNPKELREYIKVLRQKEQRSYWYIRTIKTWGILLINDNLDRLERLKEQNNELTQLLSTYLDG